MAELAGSSAISRLESGAQPAASLDTLERIGTALGAQGELFAAAGALPPRAVAALAPHWRATADVVLRERTTPAVQRVHEGAHAEAILARTSMEMVRGVDVVALAAALEPPRSVRTLRGERSGVACTAGEILVTLPAPSTAGATGPDHSRHRFLVAHGVAHISLGDSSCVWPRGTSSELRAVDLTCHLLAPPTFLENAVRAAVARRPELADAWEPSSGNIVSAVARQLGIPGWVALRRLGEDGHYDVYAEDSA